MVRPVQANNPGRADETPLSWRELGLATFFTVGNVAHTVNMVQKITTSTLDCSMAKWNRMGGELLMFGSGVGICVALTDRRLSFAQRIIRLIASGTGFVCGGAISMYEDACNTKQK